MISQGSYSQIYLFCLFHFNGQKVCAFFKLHWRACSDQEVTQQLSTVRPALWMLQECMIYCKGTPIKIFEAHHRLLESVVADTDHRSRGRLWPHCLSLCTEVITEAITLPPAYCSYLMIILIYFNLWQEFDQII